MFVIRNTFNGSYLVRAAFDNYFDSECRVWGLYKDAMVLSDKALVEAIVDSCDFAEKIEV